MNKYVVLCDCGTDRVIARIDDNRSGDGSIRIQSTTNFRMTLSVPRASGSIVTYGIGCKSCGRGVDSLSEATAGEVLDKLVPLQDQLAVEDIPAPDENTARWQQNFLPPERRTTEVARGVESRRVIPLITLCQIVSKLRDTT